MSEHEVHLWGALRPMVGGASSILMDATSIRELFSKLLKNYPAMDPHFQRGVAVSIDGKIYRDQHDTPLPEGAEIYLMPRIPGG